MREVVGSGARAHGMAWHGMAWHGMAWRRHLAWLRGLRLCRVGSGFPDTAPAKNFSVFLSIK